MRLMIRSVLTAGALALLLASASLAGSEGVKFPVFDGTIIPIELPFQPEFRPHRTVTRAEVGVEVKAGRQSEEFEMDMNVEQAVRRVGDKLEWTADIREMKIGGERFKSKSPLMTARWITGVGGDIEGFEMAFPGFQEKAGSEQIPTPQKGSPEYDAALRQFGAASKLPDAPVTSGSVLFTQKLVDLFGEDMPGLDPAALQREVKSIVRGWGYYRDRKVLVATKAFDVPADAAGTDRASVTLSGYALFDADTFAKLKEDVLMVMSGLIEGKQVQMTMHAVGEAKLSGLD